MFSNVGIKCFKLWCVLCAVQFVTARHGTQHTPQPETLFTNIAELITTLIIFIVAPCIL